MSIEYSKQDYGFTLPQPFFFTVKSSTTLVGLKTIDHEKKQQDEFKPNKQTGF